MKISYENLNKKYGNKAQEYAKDKKKTKKLLENAMSKAEKKGPFEAIWENLQLLFLVVKDWCAGNYKNIPIGSIVAIIIGLIYFVSPIDLIPDFLPGGYIDDAAVLGLIIKQVSSDLQKYKCWKQENDIEVMEE